MNENGSFSGPFQQLQYVANLGGMFTITGQGCLIDIMSLFAAQWKHLYCCKKVLLKQGVSCLMFGIRDGVKDAGSCCGQHQSLSNKTNSPSARQHDDLGLLDSFGNEVFDDLADDQGSHEGVLSC